MHVVENRPEKAVGEYAQPLVLRGEMELFLGVLEDYSSFHERNL